ncbi:MAG: PKD domain-containing protein [Candidatus Bipolaricaulaceae bacterium]
MRRVAVLVAVALLFALAGCLFRPGGLHAVIRVEPSSRRAPYTQEWAFDGSQSTGEIERYVWTIEGTDPEEADTAQGASITHKFAQPGEYTVYLTVEAAGGSFDQAQVKVDVRSQPPVASFEVWRTGSGAEVGFDASASRDEDGVIVRYLWDLGDGTIRSTTEDQLEHRYSGDGNYTVTLVVIDDYGDVSQPAVRQVKVQGSCGSCG